MEGKKIQEQGHPLAAAHHTHTTKTTTTTTTTLPLPLPLPLARPRFGIRERGKSQASEHGTQIVGE